MADKKKILVETLRAQKAPQARGYQLYRTEAEMNGERVIPYDEWLRTRAPRMDSPQQ